MTENPATDDQPASPAIDVTTPSIARVYDYVLGGKDNFDSDRAAAQGFIDRLPEAPLLARDNRDFVRRAVRWMVGDAGIRQIVDVGSGLPTAGNVHEIAREVSAGHDDVVDVVYVDKDPIVLAHGRALLSADGHTEVIQADLRDPVSIFANEVTRRRIDLSRPVGVVIAGLLHHLDDADDPVAVVDAIKPYLASGSYLAVANFFDPEDDPRAAAVEEGFLAGGLSTGRFRTRVEQEPYFSGLELVEPGLVFVDDWKPDAASPRESPVHRLYVAGVGRKP